MSVSYSARFALLTVAAVCVAGVRPALRHAQAAGVLLRLDPAATGAGAAVLAAGATVLYWGGTRRALADGRMATPPIPRSKSR
jgi:hypothetical protein